jgi:hypothetical protein
MKGEVRGGIYTSADRQRLEALAKGDASRNRNALCPGLLGIESPAGMISVGSDFPKVLDTWMFLGLSFFARARGQI